MTDKKLPSETFCVLPWMHIASNPGGSLRLCCNSNPKTNRIIKDEETQKEYKIFREPIADAWHSPTYKEFRRQFLAGERPKTCERCFREEDAGIRSPRIGYNEKWFKDDIVLTEEPPLDVRYVDLRLGNLCNLKCRMCNPWSSSMWVKDWNEVVGTAELTPNEPLNESDMDFMDVMREWPDRKGTGVNFISIAHTIEEIYLTGGEPTLAKSQYKLFDYCIENDLASGIKLKYNTNLTNIPDKMVEYWKHFKSVQLNTSIDAIGKRDRYIRYPSSWEKVEENFDKLNAMTNVNIQVHCTVQALNIVALPELLDWMYSKGMSKDQLYLNILNHPYAMNIRVLPNELKEQAISNLMDYQSWPKVSDTIKYLTAEDWHEKHWGEFVAFNKKTDKLQGMDLLTVCREFVGFIFPEADRTEEELATIKKHHSPPEQWEEFVSQDELDQLLAIYLAGKGDKREKRTGPTTLQLDHSVIDNIIARIKDKFGDFELSTPPQFFDVSKPHIIHNDDDHLFNDMYRAFLIPIKLFGEYTERPKFAVFDQQYHKGPAKFFKDSPEKIKKQYYNKPIFEYSDVEYKTDVPFDTDTREKYFSHLQPQWLDGLSVHTLFDWKPTSLITFDVNNLHCASNFLNVGVERKIGLSIFTRFKS